MVSSAKVTISEIDKSSIVSSMDGIYAGIVLNCDKGSATVPRLITSETNLIKYYGKPNPKKGSSLFSAITYLQQGNKLWVSRALHEDARYAAALVRCKVTSPPTGHTNAMSPESVTILPIEKGLLESELNSYVFPQYLTNKLYAECEGLLSARVVPLSNEETEFRMTIVSDLSVGDMISFTNESLDVLNKVDDRVGEETPTYTITKMEDRVVDYEVLKVSDTVTATIGDVVYGLEEQLQGSTRYVKKFILQGEPTIVKDVTNSSSLFVSNTDYIAASQVLVIGGDAPTEEFIPENELTGTKVSALNKSLYSEVNHFVTVNAPVTCSVDTKVRKVIQSEYEDRDAFLVTAINQGEWGNKVSISVTRSSNYDTVEGYTNGTQPFFVTVYESGVQVEQFEVTRDYCTDGYGNQMYIEDKINDKSQYIKVKNNLNTIDQEPCYTTRAYWVQNPEDIFNETKTQIVEELLKGHIEVKVNDSSGFEIGDRIRFPLGTTSGVVTLSAEYKITAIDGQKHSLTLDRKIIENTIPLKWTDSTNTERPTTIFAFDPNLNEPDEGILGGIRYFTVSTLNTLYPNYTINTPLTIDGITGTLLDAGANLFNGGSCGSEVTTGDAVNALKLLSNKERTPIQLLIQGGWTDPAFVNAMMSVITAQNATHGFCSVPFDAEEQYVARGTDAIIEAKNSYNLNDSHISIFTGWMKVFDSYNQRNIWVPPDAFAAASQSFVTRNYQIFEAAAGWKRGTLTALEVKCKFDEAERDILVENRLNPIRYKESQGLAIWGNETSLAQPSPLQMRSVAMLLIKIKTDIEPTLENTLFDLNNESTWTIVEGTLNAYMRDEIKAKGGVYDYQVKISEIITDTDLDNRRMPVFIGIKPTSDINFIPVSLTIFNNTIEITA